MDLGKVIIALYRLIRFHFSQLTGDFPYDCVAGLNLSYGEGLKHTDT